MSIPWQSLHFTFTGNQIHLAHIWYKSMCKRFLFRVSIIYFILYELLFVLQKYVSEIDTFWFENLYMRYICIYVCIELKKIYKLLHSPSSVYVFWWWELGFLRHSWFYHIKYFYSLHRLKSINVSDSVALRYYRIVLRMNFQVCDVEALLSTQPVISQNHTAW